MYVSPYPFKCIGRLLVVYCAQFATFILSKNDKSIDSLYYKEKSLESLSANEYNIMVLSSRTDMCVSCEGLQFCQKTK